jgi:cytidylate kinase-like protein
MNECGFARRQTLSSMKTEANLIKSGSFIFSQLGYTKQIESAPLPVAGSAITISQQTGAGAQEIAELAAEKLKSLQTQGHGEWKVFNRQLVEQALAEHHQPVRFARHMPEDRRSYILDTVDDFLGLRPPSWVLVPQVVETVRRLVKAGHAIVIGRGATAITAGMADVFHVRLVAALPNRIAYVRQRHSLTSKEAAAFIAKEDRGSRRYVKAHFNVRIEDHLLYDLIINTDRITYPHAALLIAQQAHHLFRSR